MASKRWLLCAAILAGLLTGCDPEGPERAEVSGTVKLDGEPVVEGAINFFPTEGTTGPEAGAPVTDGKYFIARSQGPVVGKHRVVLTKFGETGKMMQDPTQPPGKLMKERGNVMPAEAGSNSTLVREVKSGKNTLDFAITSKK
jgi:hypothetical protein